MNNLQSFLNFVSVLINKFYMRGFVPKSDSDNLDELRRLVTLSESPAPPVYDADYVENLIRHAKVAEDVLARIHGYETVSKNLALDVDNARVGLKVAIAKVMVSPAPPARASDTDADLNDVHAVFSLIKDGSKDEGYFREWLSNWGVKFRAHGVVVGEADAKERT